MKKILYITTVSSTINAFLIPHIKMLINNGYKVDCACFFDKPLDDSLINLGVRYYKIPFSRNPLAIENIKAFKELIKIQGKNQYDIIHVHTPVASVYGRLLKISYPRVRTIYTAHGYHFLKGGSKVGWLLYYPIEKIMARFTDVIININNEDYEITKNKLKPKKCYLLKGVGIDLNKYKKLSDKEIHEKKKKIGLNYNDFVVLMIAELNKNKNHIQVINAIEVLNKKYSNIKLLCIGQGNMMEYLKEQISNKNLQNNVFMLGYRENVNEIINISDIGILVSYREGLPRNIMEFMACGRKVIATNIRGCRDLICDESIGTIVEIGDYKATANAIEKYYLLWDRNFDISDSIKRYDINSINEKLLKIYKEIYSEINSEKGLTTYLSSRRI